LPEPEGESAASFSRTEAKSFASARRWPGPLGELQASGIITQENIQRP